MKTCECCGEPLNRNNKSGLCTRTRGCKRERDRREYEAHPERKKENSRQRYRANPEKWRERNLKWIKANPEKRREHRRKQEKTENQKKRRRISLRVRRATDAEWREREHIRRGLLSRKAGMRDRNFINVKIDNLLIKLEKLCTQKTGLN